MAQREFSVGMLAGCGPKEKDQKTSADGDGDKTGKASFETPPAQIPDSEIKKTVDADVVVVGAGLAGLCAAVSAAESGAKTVLIEKRETFTARGMHNAAVDSRLQKKLGIKVDKVQAGRDLVMVGHELRRSALAIRKQKRRIYGLAHGYDRSSGLETVMWGANLRTGLL